MLPGYVAGRYTYDECHIDLAVLAEFARARLIIASATGIDHEVRRFPAFPPLVTAPPFIHHGRLSWQLL